MKILGKDVFFSVRSDDVSESVQFNGVISISKKNNLQFNKAVGIIYNPLLDKWNTAKDTSVNYITYFIKK